MNILFPFGFVYSIIYIIISNDLMNSYFVCICEH